MRRFSVAMLLAPAIGISGCAIGNDVATNRVPRNWNDMVLYMAVTDRFDDGNPANNDANGPVAPGDPAGVHGGDLAGLRRRLPYLKALGITGLWITPVQTNVAGAYHGYWIRDLLSVDPRLGTLDDLRAFITDAHRHGIAVFLDIVCNHLGPLSSPRGGAHGWNERGYELVWNDPEVLPSPPFFRNLDIYHNYGEVKEWRDPYQIVGELPGGLDDLRTDRRDVREALIAVWLWWLEQTGCDGFRIDTVKHVEADFWYEFLAAMRRRARELGRRFLLFGEVYDYSDEKCASYTQPDAGGRPGFDGVLNFSLSGSIRNAFAEDRGITDLAGSIRRLALYHPDSRPTLLSFVDNHDIPRFQHLAAGDTSRLLRALTFLFAMEGIPIVYYGTEQAFRGGSTDHLNREDLFDGAWKGNNPRGDGFDTTSTVFRHIRRLTELRSATALLRRPGSTVILEDADRRLLVIARGQERPGTRGADAPARGFVAVNLGSRDADVTLPSSVPLREWHEGIRVTGDASGIPVQLPAQSVRVWLPDVAGHER